MITSKYIIGICTISFAMFAMFFGAGNIMFPIALGLESGGSSLWAILGLIVSGILIPFVGIIVMSFFDGDYNRFFSDFELWKYAKYIGKFEFCITARIEHLHPCTNKAHADQTHTDVRQFLARDKRTFQLRQAKGLLWGKNYELIT